MIQSHLGLVEKPATYAGFSIASCFSCAYYNNTCGNRDANNAAYANNDIYPIMVSMPIVSVVPIMPSIPPSLFDRGFRAVLLGSAQLAPQKKARRWCRLAARPYRHRRSRPQRALSSKAYFTLLRVNRLRRKSPPATISLGFHRDKSVSFDSRGATLTT